MTRPRWRWPATRPCTGSLRRGSSTRPRRRWPREPGVGSPTSSQATVLPLSSTCTWNSNALTYAFNSGTNDVGGDDERVAVRRVFRELVGGQSRSPFREVGTGDDPDILIGWTQANCGDANMTGDSARARRLSTRLRLLMQRVASAASTSTTRNMPGASAPSRTSTTWRSIALHEIGHITRPGALQCRRRSDVPDRLAQLDEPSAANPMTSRASRRLYPIQGPLFVAP